MSVNATATAISVSQLLSTAKDGVFVLDRDRGFVLFNQACEKITGYKRHEFAAGECPCCNTLSCQDESGSPISAARCPAKALFDGAADAGRQEMRIRRKDGSCAWIETVYSPVLNGSGRVDHVLGVIRDITAAKANEEAMKGELARIREQLQRLAGDQRPTPGAGQHPDAAGPLTRDNPTAPNAPGPRQAENATGQQQSLLLDPVLANVERDAIRRALRAADWQRNKAAQFMGISRSRLYRRMEALSIDPKERH